MAQANQAVWGMIWSRSPLVQGTAVARLTEHWNYDDSKDFFGGYCYMSQGPLPQLWANTQVSAHGLWGERLMAEMGTLQPPGRP